MDAEKGEAAAAESSSNPAATAAVAADPAAAAVAVVPSEESAEDTTDDDEDQPLVLRDLRNYLRNNNDPSSSETAESSLFDKTATAIPVAAIKALLGVVQRSRAETMMGLQSELTEAANAMVSNYFVGRKQRSYIALRSGCELFLKYVTRTFLELPDFSQCRAQVLERGERFQTISLAARDRIAAAGRDFVPSNGTVLTHGWSRVVASILLEASRSRHFDLIILEGRPDGTGLKAAKSYANETNIPVTVVPDSAMAYSLEKVDVVLVGAEGVFENGGVVNKLGTYALATCAKAAGKPFYVAAESYKFARMYPLEQSDVYEMDNNKNNNDNNANHGHNHNNRHPYADALLPENVRVDNPPVDFTPAKFITLLFTDLGVLTPSAVSDELIRLYQ